MKWDNVDPWNDWPYNPGVGLLKPDVSAPAVNVNSLVPPSGYSGNTWSGTSMACPHAAGVAALMLQKNPTLSPAGIDSLLELSSLDLGTVGKDNQFGSGRIDALAAVNLVPATQAPQLSWSSFEILDATNDGVIDPGEAFDVVFTLTNTSALVAATSVVGGLAVVAGGPVAVTEGAAAFGTIATNGGTADNTADVFSLTADPGRDPGRDLHDAADGHGPGRLRGDLRRRVLCRPARVADARRRQRPRHGDGHRIAGLHLRHPGRRCGLRSRRRQRTVHRLVLGRLKP